MAITIRFNPPPEADINRIRVYESTTPDGSFLAIQTTAITGTSEFVLVPTGTMDKYYRLSFVDTADQESPLSPVVRGNDISGTPSPELRDWAKFIYPLGLLYFGEDQAVAANSAFSTPGVRTLQQGWTRERRCTALFHVEHEYDEVWVGGGVRALVWQKLVLNEPVRPSQSTRCPGLGCDLEDAGRLVDPYILMNEMSVEAVVGNYPALVSTMDMLPVGVNIPTYALEDGDTLTVKTRYDADAKTMTFHPVDFGDGDIGAFTIGEAVTVINTKAAAQGIAVVAEAQESCLVLRTTVGGFEGTLELGGTAAELLGFDFDNLATRDAYHGQKVTMIVRFRDTTGAITDSPLLRASIVYNPWFPVIPWDVRVTYCSGLDFAMQNGTVYPDSELWNHCVAAVGRMEYETALLSYPRRLMAHPDRRGYVEGRDYDMAYDAHDYYPEDYMKWGWCKLRWAPIQSVSRVALTLPPGLDMIVFPSQWIELKKDLGSINIVPAIGSGLTSFALGTTGHLIPLLSRSQQLNIPGSLEVDFIGGYGWGKLQSTVEGKMLWDAMCMLACVATLLVIGDARLSGISSQSLSDGVISESISTTAGGENTLYGARITQYRDKILNDILPRIRQRKRGIVMEVC